MTRLVFQLGNNWISLAGAAMTTSSAFVLVWFWFMEITSPRSIHPYMGIILFLILPALFLVGLVLIPIGLLRERRKRKAAGEAALPLQAVDFRQPGVRRLLTVVGVLTFINVAILGTAGLKGVEYMDSNQFCGLTCHTVMSPEYTAFLDSPHSRVGCAQCHIGHGAPALVRAKISGSRQLFAVAFGTFSRPIPSPVEHLRPARETCEQCHWPQKFTNDKLIVRTKFAEDEANTATTSILLLKIGGHTPNGTTGIHGRHLDAMERISYITTDARRQEIPKVIYRDDNGQMVEYVTEDFKKLPKETVDKATVRKMDCIDCHNRPTHAFHLPDRALDKALAEKRMSAELPFLKKQALELLKVDYPDQKTAAAKIPVALAEYYRTAYPEIYKQKRAQVDTAGEVVKAIYLRNVFPEMKITWGTHPNNIGHEEAVGCFRCHDGNHTATDGRTIKADCDTCHTILAQDEKDPKILKDFGMK
ncbi:MAG: NapC/NirT family cytochrome c [Holophagaceae bacterium]|uniref:NapC/NirT family cytochrome c n=1 Tax=Candidatus Geothrix odensensis TaxID=2954440 RepID=A0A936F1I4_9BACT|nr:NapC/NirT family cytochrome c [Candidatus Geothrix odensensis]MBK8788978.1 NapC/NirT family cytochrome c [Holophagaceae bacterium]